MKNTRVENKVKELRNICQELRNNGNPQEIIYARGIEDTINELKEFLNGTKEQTKNKLLYGRR